MINSEEEFLLALQKRSSLDLSIVDHNEKYSSVETLSWYRDNVQSEMDYYESIHNADRIGDWISTITGRMWPQSPKVEDIKIEDIAHALSLINRFNGYTREAYSVAQHSVYVSFLVPKKQALFGLLHDAGEAYLGDVITPIKKLIRDIYKPIEDNLMNTISDKFGFSMSDIDKKLVKQADNTMLVTEMRDLLSHIVYPRSVFPCKPRKSRILRCWSAKEAEKLFLKRFEELYSY